MPIHKTGLGVPFSHKIALNSPSLQIKMGGLRKKDRPV
jgi:hypothetical protein